MSDLAPGSFVRHPTKPEWGPGRVSAVDSQYVTVVFEGDVTRERRFPIAAHPLVSVADDAVAADSPLRAPAPKTRGSAKPRSPRSRSAPGTDRRAPCEVCGVPLNKGIYRDERRWKSCPECSVSNGHRHVLRPCPEAFTTTEARVTDDNPIGVQSYCEMCRPAGGGGQLPTEEVRDCGAFAGQLEEERD